MNAVLDGTLVVLLVEDNPADVAFFREALEETGIAAAVHVANDGGKALRFLRREEPYADAPRPDVIVLDLNIPVKRGQEVAAEMAADPELRMIPVAVLTTSTSEGFVRDLFQPGRCLYFVKTDQFVRLQEIIRQIAAHARAAHD
jgi:two-component system response regulator